MSIVEELTDQGKDEYYMLNIRHATNTQPYASDYFLPQVQCLYLRHLPSKLPDAQ